VPCSQKGPCHGLCDSGYIAVQLHASLPRPTFAFSRSLTEPNDPGSLSVHSKRPEDILRTVSSNFYSVHCDLDVLTDSSFDDSQIRIFFGLVNYNLTALVSVFRYRRGGEASGLACSLEAYCGLLLPANSKAAGRLRSCARRISTPAFRAKGVRVSFLSRLTKEARLVCA